MMKMERKKVKMKKWMKFDVKNKELFGKNMKGDEGREE
jgi:hypothetical protein